MNGIEVMRCTSAEVVWAGTATGSDACRWIQFSRYPLSSAANVNV